MTRGVLTAAPPVLRSKALLHSLRVHQVVCCGAEAIAAAESAPRGSVVACVAAADAAAVKAVVETVQHGRRSKHATLIIADGGAAGCASLLALALVALDGMTQFDATLMVSEAGGGGA